MNLMLRLSLFETSLLREFISKGIKCFVVRTLTEVLLTHLALPYSFSLARFSTDPPSPRSSMRL